MIRRTRSRVPVWAVLISALVIVGAPACEPSVGVSRVRSATPREVNCHLTFVELGNEDLSGRGPYEVVGHVVLAQEGSRDPLDEKWRKLVRPRACALGGEAVGIMASGHTEKWALSAGGTTVDYVVLRRRAARANRKGF